MKFNPDPKPVKQPKKKASGEAALFLEIWLSRDHVCVNCGDYLREERNEAGDIIINPMYFDHIKPKVKYPELRLSKKNIRILCFDCHFIRHNKTQEEFDKRKKIQKSLGKLQ